MPTIPVIDPKEHVMLTRKFLEGTPLYKNHTLKKVLYLESLKYSESIKQECPTCLSEQTFNFKSVAEQEWMKKSRTQDPCDTYKGRSLKIDYECKGCNVFNMNFTLQFSNDGTKVQKVGQFPGYNVDVDLETKDRLGDHLQLYRKGLISESQGYGIGAFAYYRRIVETIIGSLLRDAVDLVPEAKKEVYTEIIKDIALDKTAEDKIHVAYDLLPGSLKPNGKNHLKLMYEICSIGIHGLSDDECLDLSIDLRKNLEAFIHLLNTNARSAQELSASTARLLEKRAELKDKK
ncbi:MAG: hypothetical protein K2X47_10900 [Bdellovibrionales bacterium]|nr:hypothetical protein [Bdellovibrionales bacterium]